jgi:succinyl-diaminopimelate desuccinylase
VTLVSKLDTALESVDNFRNEMTAFMIELLKIKAVNPDGGGKGEYERAIFVKKKLESCGIKVAVHEVPDARVPEGVRLNLTSIIHGEDNQRTLWLAAHLDTVPEGARELWTSDPFEPLVKDDKIFARGAEDNGQAIASSLFMLKALRLANVKPPINIGVAYVSDEESGSKYGMIPLLEEKDLFRSNDIAIVPDTGAPDGSQIEVAEKSILWLKITTKGKQVHASIPDMGLNAHRVALKFALELDSHLHSKYSTTDSLFEPPTSTFEPTKHELNVDNVNTVPGIDVQYFDCRILPCYQITDVMNEIDSIRQRIEQEAGAKIEIKPIQQEQNTVPTSTHNEIVTRLTTALKKLRGIDAKYVGIGGGTVALYFRRKGIATAVWSTLDEMAHQPNEYCKIQNMIDDAKVFVHVAAS